MCGIAGIIDFKNADRVSSSNLQILSKKLQHRGPDDEGFLVDHERFFGDNTPANVIESQLNYSPKQHIQSAKAGAISLLQRRLSIIDLSHFGHQPMCDSSGDYNIVYNGEVYNYLELRTELANLGHTFISNTDTEVLLKAYMAWGEKCIEKFNGMWAFVIWDKKANKLFASRDRTGVKPFYYHFDSTSFSFASELKALVALPFIQSRVNGNAAVDFLVFNKVEHREESMFEGVFELPPHHNLMLDLTTEKITVVKYKELTLLENNEENQSDLIRERLKLVIIRSIRLRLQSDVPVGACLSGGIDSSIITGVVNSIQKEHSYHQLGSKLKTFTCSFENKQFSESYYAEKVAELNNCLWFETLPNQNNLFSDFDDLVYSQDLPLLSTSTFAQYSVMKLAKEHGVKVLLDGQGADELFGGYAPHRFAYLNELLRKKGVFQFLKHLSSFGGGGAFLRNYIIYQVLPRTPISLRKKVLLAYYPELKFLNADFLETYIQSFECHSEPIGSSLNDMLLHEFFGGPLKRLLKCEDRNSMRFSIESRTPFADDMHLMQEAFSISGKLKLESGVSKKVLRDAMKEFLPSQVYYRTDKMGFVTPNNAWVKGLKENFKLYFENCDESIFNKERVLGQYDRFFSPKSNIENYRVFKFIGFAAWQNQFRIRL